MPLHPQARAAIAAQPSAPLTLDQLDEARQAMRAAVPVETGYGPALDRVVDVVADGVPARLYGDGDGLLVYVHGGGWVAGDLDTHDALCRRLAITAGCPVLAVDYRRAPEWPAPTAVTDVERAVAWARGADARRYAVDAGRIAIAGDSAGGHVAAVVARRARDRGEPFVHQTLIYPVIDPAAAYPPELDGYGLSSAEMRFYWDAYAPPGVPRTHPDVAPRCAELTGLPPALVLTAEFDVLRDEGEAYAAALADAGVPVVAVRYQGMVHGFARKFALFDAATAAAGQIATAVRAALTGPR